MEILFLLTQDLNSPSGLGRNLPFAKELVRLGHKVSIAALHSNYAALSQKKLNVDGVQVEYVAQMHVQKIGNEKRYFPGWKLLLIVICATWQLTRAALRFGGDVIHIGKPHPMNGMAGLLAKLLKGKTIYVDCDDDETGSNRFSNKYQQWLVSFFEKYITTHAVLITSNTRWMVERLRGWGIPEKKIVYVPNGVDRHRFSPAEAEKVSQLREMYQLEDARVVAYIGSLSLSSHPVDLLIRCFSQVVEKIPTAILLVVGGGEDFHDLQQLSIELGLSKKIRFVGRVTPDAVKEYYQLAEVSVDPVFDDAVSRGRSPLKMFESWAAGIPFVTAPVGDRAFLAGDPPAACLVQPGSSEALAEAIIQVLMEPEIGAEFRDRGFRQIEQFYWDRIAEQSHWIYR